MTEGNSRRDVLKYGGLGLASGLAGCMRGGTATSNTTQNTAAPLKGDSDLSLQAYERADIDWRQFEGTTINIGAVQHSWVESIRPLIPVFEKLTGIDVVWSLLPEQQFRTKRLTDVSTGAGKFDLFFMDQVVNQFREAGWLQPIDSYLQRDDLFDEAWYQPKDLLGVCRKTAHGAGRTQHWTGLPITVEVHTMFYRKDLYEKYGLEVPKTTEEFRHNARVIHENEAGVFGLANRGQKGYGMNVYTMDAWIREHGGRLWKEYGVDSGLDESKAIEAGNYYVNTLRDFGPPSIGTMTWSEVVTAMQQGTVGHIMNDANLFWSTLANASPSGGDIGIAKMVTPAGTPSRFVPGAFSWQLSTSKAAQNSEAAFLFMVWATSKPTQRWMSLHNDAPFPTRRSVWSLPAYEETYGKEFTRVSLESLEHGEIEPYGAMYPVWAQKYSVLLQKAITGQKPAEPTFSNAAHLAELTVDET